MKQTAIEWLMEIDKSRAITIEEWQQAREMEMRQIMEAFNAGEHYDGSDGEIKYYRETFKTNEK
jgi:hypothetical protein